MPAISPDTPSQAVTSAMPPKLPFPVLLHLRLSIYHIGTLAAFTFTLSFLILAFTSPYMLFTWHPVCMALYFYSAVWSAQILAGSGGNATAALVGAVNDTEPRQSRESISDLLGERANGGDGHDEEGGRPVDIPEPPRKKEWLPLPLPLITPLSHLTRRSRITLHFSFHLLALAFALAGLAVIVYNKILGGKAHFQTWHGLLGIIAIGFFSGQVVFGFLARNEGSFASYFRRAHGTLAFSNFRKLHRINGTLVFLPLLSAVSGLAVFEGWTIGNLQEKIGHTGTSVVQGVLIACVVLAVAGVAVQGSLR